MWEIEWTLVSRKEALQALLRKGWQPFAVTEGPGGGETITIWLKRWYSPKEQVSSGVPVGTAYTEVSTGR